ncbi:MAG: ribosome biogenesis GTPase Der [Buchnera aphidicola (Nurudea yanoniella)]
MDRKIIEQTKFSIQESNLICFLVSAKDGLVSEDLDISNEIRSYNKDVLVIVNKIDGMDYEFVASEFYSLKFPNIHCISATNGIGIISLIKKISSVFLCNSSQYNYVKYSHCIPLEEENENIRKKHDASLIKVAVIGKPNVGKSTFINNILNQNRMITDGNPGTTRDSIWNITTYKKRKYIFIDTAGIRKKSKIIDYIEKFSVKKTIHSIKLANVVILILDATNSISNQDLKLFNHIVNSGCGIIIVFNKCDKISEIEKKNIIQSKEIKIMHIGIIYFISSIRKLKTNEIFQSIDRIFKYSIKKFSTSKLTKIMQLAVKNHRPSVIKGNKVKLKYAHLGSKNPLTIIIHGKKLEYLSSTYKKYLLNFFIKMLKIIGNPIHFSFRNSENSYFK